MSNTGTPADPSNQRSIMENDNETTTEFRGQFSTRAELQSLVAIRFRNLDKYALKGAMI